MTPIVTLGQLHRRLGQLLEDGLVPDEEIVLTTHENAGMLITLGYLDSDGGVHTIDGVVFSGIEEI